tara:strand:- start:145 stop:441 length:297 start_codon:yes stop_codon:yes gene_type:complete
MRQVARSGGLGFVAGGRDRRLQADIIDATVDLDDPVFHVKVDFRNGINGFDGGLNGGFAVAAAHFGNGKTHRYLLALRVCLTPIWKLAPLEGQDRQKK